MVIKNYVESVKIRHNPNWSYILEQENLREPCCEKSSFSQHTK